jgi:DNA-binding PucR family transcriptional regulator
VTVRDWAIVAAVLFWGVFVAAAVWALSKVVGLLEEATRDLRESTDRILPTLEQVNETAAGVNVELARVDTIVAGVQSITHTTDQMVGVIHATLSNPLIKAAAFAAGAAKAGRALRD